MHSEILQSDLVAILSNQGDLVAILTDQGGPHFTSYLWRQFIVRKRCKDYVDRQLWQSVLIKRENPEINTQLSESVKEGDWIKYTWKLM